MGHLYEQVEHMQPISPSAEVKRIAVLMPLHLGFARSVLYGIAHAARTHLAVNAPQQADRKSDPWTFLFLSSTIENQSERLSRLIREFRPHALLARMDEPFLRKLAARTGVPTLELFHKERLSEFPRVALDDGAIGRMAADYFFNRGFHRLAVFGDASFIWSADRATGLKDALREHGRTSQSKGFNPHLAHEFTHANSAPADEVAEWLGNLPRPTAVFATNDQFAAYLLDVARQRGVRVPDELPVLGVDDDEILCMFSAPPLSSVQTGLEFLGATAVGLLTRILAGEAIAAKTILVPPRGVITRQSTDILAVQDATVAAALKFIRQRRDIRITVDDVARVAALNRRALERRILAVTGRSILQEIHSARAERIKELLRSDLTQDQIAHLCEFSSAQRMVRMFKNTTGMTPSEYRRLQGNR